MIQKSPSFFNREFRIIFKPKRDIGMKYKKFLIGAGRLTDYIGHENAQTAFKRVLSSTMDKDYYKIQKVRHSRFLRKITYEYCLHPS